ncbi:MAG: response regulator [Lachnospiraceae bacterium]|nr:response regulator [Lachnospiraceae bacterium]
MIERKIVFTAPKESFIVRVLSGKAKDAGFECAFVPFTVNDLNAVPEDIQLVVIYLEDETMPDEKVLHFLTDRTEEKGSQLILVGGGDGIAFAKGFLPDTLVYASFRRPVDNEKFVKTLTEYFDMIEAGEFRKSILIVDDDPQYLTLVRQWLSVDYKVFLASSGLQAIKYLGKNKVDLILLDHEMPVTSGPQVLNMLRSDEDTKNIPVMFLTGKSDRESVMKVVALHPEGYFLKTIQRKELLEELKKYFQTHM